ncbi:hypothetical protein BP6252_02250 [Coleophoma cylindrospora]|uniref:Radical SAM core domain-containing protein n=1 Tax=Coleophoma cylindrospora TaxID=1849047 RepID=A0A3D8SEA1_9HELO|nr:hypothetical protein BP6252_02250 [Coleophoma cylindrospora]
MLSILRTCVALSYRPTPAVSRQSSKLICNARLISLNHSKQTAMTDGFKPRVEVNETDLLKTTQKECEEQAKAKSHRLFHPRSAPISPSSDALPPKRAFESQSSAFTHLSPGEIIQRVIPDITKATQTLKSIHHDRYWRHIPSWKDVPEEIWLSHKWQLRNDIKGEKRLKAFLHEVLPVSIPPSITDTCCLKHIKTAQDFITEVELGIKHAPMTIRLTPHMLSIINWANPLNDPILRQCIPLKSRLLPNHPKLTLDSLHETEDSPVEGLVHRYPDKVLFLSTDVCPFYCSYCTRSYAIGTNTDLVKKASFKPTLDRWKDMILYIARNPQVQDVVVSGGDTYILTSDQIRWIGEQLLRIPHIKRFRFATKGLAVSPCRILDPTDAWAEEIIRLTWKGRALGKAVAVHTHFNHPSELTWINRVAAQRLFASGVVLRNQSVLLKGVNDNIATMSHLIRELADNNIQPYYVYQHDMVKHVEHLRTPLQTILDLETQIRGSIAGFMMPNFVVDLPGGGGKRLACSYKSYDPLTGISTFIAPAVTGRGKEDRIYEYYDPRPNSDPAVR